MRGNDARQQGGRNFAKARTFFDPPPPRVVSRSAGLVIILPMVLVNEGRGGRKNCDSVGTCMLNQNGHPKPLPAAFRFDSLQCLNHHSNFRPIFATLGRGAG
jgi:hypothetical protein